MRQAEVLVRTQLVKELSFTDWALKLDECEQTGLMICAQMVSQDQRSNPPPGALVELFASL